MTLLLADPAFAAENYEPLGQISGPTPSTQFVNLKSESVAVNDFNNHIYVADSGAGLIYDFTSASDTSPTIWNGSNTPSGSFGGGHVAVAVQNTSGDVYVADATHALIDKFDSSGNLIGSFGAAGQLTGAETPAGSFSPAESGTFGITVDQATGDLYVIDADHKVIDVFGSSGNYLPAKQITATPPGLYGFGSRYVDGIAVDDATGNTFVSDSGIVQTFEFDSAGNYVATLTGSNTPAGSFGGGFTSVAANNNGGDIYITDSIHGVVDRFDSSGNYLDQITGALGNGFNGIAIDQASGEIYVSSGSSQTIKIFGPPLPVPRATTAAAVNVAHNTATLKGHVDPFNNGPITDCHFEYVTIAAYEENLAKTHNGFSDLSSGGSAPCVEGNSFTVPTEVHADVAGLTTSTTYRYHISVSNVAGTFSANSQDFETLIAVHDVQTEAANELTNVSAALHGSFTVEAAIATSSHFEYGTSTNYTHRTPEVTVPGPAATRTEDVTVAIENLVPNTTYHYRVVAENEFGTTDGEDRTFITEQPPTIEAFSSSDLTSTSAVLHARVNPNVRAGGTEAECHFEYGPTVAYGTSVSCPESLAGTIGKAVEVSIEGLQRGVTYHFRFVAQNEWGTVTSEDQTFEFLPPSCPNTAIRQLTGAGYLPDCRAYEIVSPGEAQGALLFTGGPNTGQAINPSRLSFTVGFSALPGADAIVTAGDLYVATRTARGWVSHYIGLPGNQAGCMGGPPPFVEDVLVNPAWATNPVLSDPSMSHFLNWLAAAPAPCGLGNNGIADRDTSIAPPSNAPFLWAADGTLERRLPSNLAQIPGALEALACPGSCGGETAASGDLTHFAFSSDRLAFAQGGLTKAPGSAYDDNLATGEVNLISKLPGTQGGGDLPEDPAHPGDFIHFPAVSTDGSRILMSSGPTPNRNQGQPDPSVRLYMRVNDAVTYDVSAGHDVSYVGATPDASKTFFTSEEQLTPEDKDHSTDLYMWSEQGAKEGHPLTLISEANNAAGHEGEPGNGDNCQSANVVTYNPHGVPATGSPWTAKCGILPYSDHSYALSSTGGIGGNDISDSAVAANGDIYFYSPEQLDSDHGELGQQNLYLYRGGNVQFIATLHPERRCAATGFNKEGTACPEGPVLRMEVSPDDSHMAFVTAARLTPYDNNGHLEMYSYTPATRNLVCDSCNPKGTSATADVQASEDGLFLTNDGRTFFSTTEALVAQDTNEGEDVYEFADGRPRLITTGTASETASALNGPAYSVAATSEVPGLVGVSADGTDVYFATFATLVSEDHNGNFFKIYDARTNGGFAQAPPVQPCQAAEECHGPGTEAPVPPTRGTVGHLTGGNVTPRSLKRRHRKPHHRAKKNHGHQITMHGAGGGR